MPENLPDEETESDKYQSLQDFSQKVEVILQTVNENEFQAATTFLKSPNDLFKKAVTFPMNCMVLGMFAKKKTALIQTGVGDKAGKFIEKALTEFPKTVYVIGVGVCFAFKSKENCILGDVIVSEKICTLANSAIGGKVEDRGETIEVVEDLQAIFCRTLNQHQEFIVCKEGRVSKVHSGTITSFPHVVKDATFRDKLLEAVPVAIGGEMEGGQLLKVKKEKSEIKGVIAIKGVVDFADKDKSKGWQFISARAALHYIECKLLNERSFLGKV